MGRELSFWAAVALVAIVAQPLFKLFAASGVGGQIPGVRELADLSSK